LNQFKNKVTSDLDYKQLIEVTASPFISTQIAYVNGSDHVFIANFKGLKGKERAQQLVEKGMNIVFPAKENSKVYCLPFLGDIVEINARIENDRLICTLPDISRGAVVWVQ
jgi:hypothetical protein